MRKLTFALVLLASGQLTASENIHWNQFRGPNGDGKSTAKNLPVEFDEAKNVRWKIPIPDKGWSSPVVWGNEIWLTAGSDEKKELRAISVDLESGKILNCIKVFDMIQRQVMEAYKHDSPHLNSPATPTPVVEEDRVFVHFGSQGIACLDRKTGDKIWERRDLRIYQPVRQGSSPIVDDKSLYVAYDGIDKQFFVALDKETGKTRWQTNRNVDTDWDATLRGRGFSAEPGGGKPNDNKKAFATATLIDVNGQRQLIAPAAEATIAYAPETGEEIWRVLQPGGFNVAARPVFAHGMVYVFTSGLTGYLMAIRTNGSGDVTETHIAWSTTRSTPNIPSPVLVDGLLFMVTDKGGIVRCLDAKTGDPQWRKRLGGNHWASPLYADGKLYFLSKEGEVTVLTASKGSPEVLATNELNAEFIASPAVADGSLILRSTTHLYCFADGFERSAEEVAADIKPKPKKGKKVAKRNVEDDGKFAALGARLKELVKEGKLTGKEAIELYQLATGAEKSRGKAGASDEKSVDMKTFTARFKEAVRTGRMTDAEAKEAYKKALEKVLAGKGGSKAAAKGKRRRKPGARPGSVNFYAIVIGRLNSKDLELGELTMEVDYIISDEASVANEFAGKQVKLVGIAGQFLDNLLQIKRGDTFKVRTGDYNPEKNEFGFGYKFHVLERTTPFKPENFGVPPDGFRGFRGKLVGKVVEAAGYEVLLQVSEVKPAKDSKATNPASIHGKRIRIAGFYNDHRDAFGDLHEGDMIRVSTTHNNPELDAIDVTDVLEELGQN